MALTVTLLERITRGGVQTDKTQTLSGGAGASLSETIPAESADLEIIFTLDFSACVFFYIMCDRDLVVETNSASVPDDTLTLVANMPYIWHTDSLPPFLITADITSLFATLAAGADATLVIESLSDPTP